ncbi:MAG: sodium:proton antiporter [Lentisphaeria bacterium]|nr:sodium:proton antiporter [Lentisphaeria bacterium]
MMELFTLLLFCVFLLICLLFDLSILYALAAGLVLFLLYGKRKGYSRRELMQMTLSGVMTVKNILITFVLIGMLTALWREAGTIPAIVCYTAKLIRPSVFLLMAFLLNCLLSILTGTAFGTAATMGVICTTIAAAMQVEPLLVGGAVLSGVFFGDRCSPVSTSALLVSELTGTNIFRNIKNMLRTALVPFIAACTVYGLAGAFSVRSEATVDIESIFGSIFALNWVVLLPALVILALSLMQINVKIAMTASILVSIPICLFVQDTPVGELPSLLLTGFRASDPEIAAMLNGGGIQSMLRVAAIVCLSSSYSGIFQKTGLLLPAKQMISRLSARTNPYTATLATSIVAGMIACNQTLAIMLTDQLCSQEERDKTRFSIFLEDTAVLVSPLIPWSIAGAVPLATIGAPSSSVIFACFLYFVPVWRLITEAIRKRRGCEKSPDLSEE